MTTKSHVTMEQHACAACGNVYDTGAILLDRRLRQTFESKTVTGFGLCPECQKMKDDGYVALVECDPTKSGISAHDKTAKAEQVYRTGRIVHMKEEAFRRVFEQELPPKRVCFIEPGVIEKLQARQAGDAQEERATL